MTEEFVELQKSIDLLQGGYWMPIAIIGGALSVIAALLLFIYNSHRKNSSKRHSDNEETLKELATNQTELRILNAKYDTKLDSHQGQISENRRNIKEVQKKVG